MQIRFGGMAKNIMKTDEGVARMAEIWKWVYERDLGSKVKDLEVEWMRFVCSRHSRTCSTASSDGL